MSSVLTIGAYQSGVEIGAWQADSEFGSTAGYLPDLRLETPNFTNEVVDANLSCLEIEAEASEIFSIWTDPREGLNPILPELRIEAQSGERGSLDRLLSDLRVDVRMGIRGAMDLSTLEIEATGLAGGRGILDKNLPALSLTARTGARADMKLSWLAIEADGYPGDGAWSLAAYLPALIMAPYASGDTYGGSESTMTESGRFDGALLRYDRWAS